MPEFSILCYLLLKRRNRRGTSLYKNLEMYFKDQLQYKIMNQKEHGSSKNWELKMPAVPFKKNSDPFLKKTKAMLIVFILTTVSLLLLTVCQTQNPKLSSPPSTSPALKIFYVFEPLFNGEDELKLLFNPAQLVLLQKMNRRDLKHLARLKQFIVPDTLISNELVYSPLPMRYTWAEKYPKALIVHQPGQVFGGYEKGKLVRWGPVSSGKKTAQTPSGLFHLNWKTLGRLSTVNQEWSLMFYFNFQNKLGLSLHAYDVPGFPASHSCIRLLLPDAEWLYHWGEQCVPGDKPWEIIKEGTPLLIIGKYDFNSSPPWSSLEWANSGIQLPENPPLEQEY
jgi:hypothetical protein